MHDIDQRSKYIESIEPIDLREVDDNSQNGDNMKLRAICKTSSFDIESIVNNLHEIDETSSKQILNDYHYTDNYNSEITPANRNINCADWFDGVCGWSFTHPYPYFVNYASLLSKRKNRKYDVEFDESIGMFVPNAENLLLQQDTTTATANSEQASTSNPHYMKDLNRNSRIQSNAGSYSNVVYDSKYHKRAGSANTKPISYNNTNHQDPPNHDLSASDNGGLGGGMNSVGQPQIFPFGSQNTKTNSAFDSKRPLYNQDMINNEQDNFQLRKDKTSVSDPPPVDSATVSKQMFQNLSQERFNHIKRTFNVLINKGGSINGITGNDLRLKRAELLNARLNGEEFANIFDENSRPPIPQSNSESRNNNTPVLPPATQKLYSFYRSDSEMSAYNKMNLNRVATLKQQQQQTSDNNLSTNSSNNGSSLQYNRNISVNQINAQLQNYTAKASKNSQNNSNLLVDGESVVFGDNSFANQTNNNSNSNANNSNSFAALYATRRKPEDFNDIKLRINNYNAKNLIANQQQQQQYQQQSAPLLQAQPYKFNDTKSKAPNAAELSILANQTIIPFSDQSVLPPIISGKRINLPHGPHRYPPRYPSRMSYAKSLRFISKEITVKRRFE